MRQVADGVGIPRDRGAGVTRYSRRPQAPDGHGDCVMKVKALELRDGGTFIPILCVDMNPGRMGTPVYGAQRYLLRRCGYTCDGHPNILMTRMDGGGRDGARAINDPY